MENDKLFEKVLAENAQDLYQNTANEFDKIAELFFQYFDTFVPKEDKAPGSSQIRISEALSPEQERKREILLGNISSFTLSITNRIQNIYNNFINSPINKNDADTITEQMIVSLQFSTNCYGLYLHDNYDSHLSEVKALFESFINQSKILDAILHSKNEKDQGINEQLEVIYTDDGKLNIGVLPNISIN